MKNFFVNTADFQVARARKVVLIKHDGIFYCVKFHCLLSDKRTLVSACMTSLRRTNTLDGTPTAGGEDPSESRQWVRL